MKIKGYLLRRWAVQAGYDPGTARRFLRGQNVRPKTRAYLLRAADELGIAHLLPAADPTEKASAEANEQDEGREDHE